MRYRLRTLLIALILMPPILAEAWFSVVAVMDRYRPPPVGWGGTRLIHDPDFAKFIDQVIEAEINRKADNEFPNLEIIVE